MVRFLIRAATWDLFAGEYSLAACLHIAKFVARNCAAQAGMSVAT